LRSIARRRWIGWISSLVGWVWTDLRLRGVRWLRAWRCSSGGRRWRWGDGC